MFRQTAAYAVARWVPGVVNFAAIVLYTRLLGKDDYGTYAVVLAWVALANTVGFQWLRSGIRRFWIAYRDDQPAFLSFVRGAFLQLSVAATGLAAVVFVVFPAQRALVVAGLVLVLGQAWFEVNQAFVLAEIRPARYGMALFLRAGCSLAAGAGLAAAGYGALGVVAGIALGYFVSGGWLGVRQWHGAARGVPNVEARARLLAYGLPLTLTYGLNFIINSSDRILLGWLGGLAEVGPYAASYDLTQQGMTALMVTVNLGAFSIAVRALEVEGAESARIQLRRHAVVLLGLALPAAAGLVLLAPNVAHVVLGAPFRTVANQLIPVIAVAALLAGLKAFYFDLAFQLHGSTVPQVWSSGAAAIVNIGANIVLIPQFGAVGAAWATLAAFVVGLSLSVMLGRRAFLLPVPWRAWIQIGLATTIMIGVVSLLRDGRGILALVAQVAAGGVAYILIVLLFDVAKLRSSIALRLAR